MFLVNFFLNVEDYMLPCLNKKLFGTECMGCGLQRATALFFQGEFVAAFKMYPAIYPLGLLILFLLLNSFFKIKYSNKITILLTILTVGTILGNYAYKMLTNQL